MFCVRFNLSDSILGPETVSNPRLGDHIVRTGGIQFYFTAQVADLDTQDVHLISPDVAP